MTEVPRDVDAERIVVGAMLDHTAFEVAGAMGTVLPGDVDQNHLRVLREVADAGLRSGHFFDPSCARVFAAVNWLLERGRPVTAEAAWRVCRASKNPAHHIPASWFDALSDSLPSTYGVGWWAERIVELSARRRLMATGEMIADGRLDAGQAQALVGQIHTEQVGEPAQTEAWPVVGPQL